MQVENLTKEQFIRDFKDTLHHEQLIKVAKVQGYITADGLNLLRKFKENQETWQD